MKPFATIDIPAPVHVVTGRIAKHWGKHHLVIDGRVVFTGTVGTCEAMLDAYLSSDYARVAHIMEAGETKFLREEQ